MKILVISLAGIGDTLLATPLLHALRDTFPKARIDVLVMWGGAKQILDGNPHITHVYHENLLQAGPRKGFEKLTKYRHEHYDISINTYPQGKRIYRVTAWYINALRRLSHVYENRSFLDRLLVTQTLEQDYNIHCVDNNLNLLSLLGTPIPKGLDVELYFTPAEKEWAETFVSANNLRSKKVLGVHVGSGKTKNLMLKRWPVDHYVDVLRRLLAAHPDLVALLFGGPEEKTENEIILKELNNPRVLPVPSRTMKEAAAALGHCEFFLSVDNAFMHLAAAMKVPKQVVIESPTFNKTIEPYGRPFVLVPNPMVAGRNLDYYRYDGRNIQGGEQHLLACMRSVTPDMVCRALENLLGQ